MFLVLVGCLALYHVKVLNLCYRVLSLNSQMGRLLGINLAKFNYCSCNPFLV
jgi:hypothetical protein